MQERVTVRMTKEAQRTIKELMTKYPADYKNTSEVVRAGIFTLKRWKKFDSKKDMQKMHVSK